jgi:hypothetical protein
LVQEGDLKPESAPDPVPDVEHIVDRVFFYDFVPGPSVGPPVFFGSLLKLGGLE